MSAIITIFYLFLVILLFVMAGFIVFHFHRYSLRRSGAFSGIIFFLSVFLILLAINSFAFFSLPLTELFGELPFTQMNGF